MPWLVIGGIALLGLLFAREIVVSSGAAPSPSSPTNLLLPGRSYVLAIDATPDFDAAGIQRALASSLFLEPTGEVPIKTDSGATGSRWAAFAKYVGNDLSVATDRGGQNHIQKDGSLLLPWEPALLGLPQGSKFVVSAAVSR